MSRLRIQTAEYVTQQILMKSGKYFFIVPIDAGSLGVCNNDLYLFDGRQKLTQIISKKRWVAARDQDFELGKTDRFTGYMARFQRGEKVYKNEIEQDFPGGAIVVNERFFL